MILSKVCIVLCACHLLVSKLASIFGLGLHHVVVCPLAVEDDHDFVRWMVAGCGYGGGCNHSYKCLGVGFLEKRRVFYTRKSNHAINPMDHF